MSARTARDYANYANKQAKSGNIDDAIKVNLKSLEIQEKSQGPNSLLVANSYLSLSKLYQKNKNYSEALESLNKALKIRIQNSGETHQSVAEIYLEIASLYNDKGDTRTALTYHEKADAITSQNSQGEDLLRRSVDGRVELHIKEGNFEMANSLLRRSATLNSSLKQSPDRNDPRDAAYPFKKIADNHERQNDLEEALENYKEFLEIFPSETGDDANEIIYVNSRIASIHRRLNDTEKALDYLNKALYLYKNFEAKDNLNPLPMYEEFILCLEIIKSDVDVLGFSQKSLEYLLNLGSKDIKKILGLQKSIGKLSEKLGNNELAISSYTNFIDFSEKNLTKFEEEFYDVLNRLIQLLENQEKFLEAYFFCKKGIKCKQISLNSESTSLHYLLAEICSKNGDLLYKEKIYKEAAHKYSESLQTYKDLPNISPSTLYKLNHKLGSTYNHLGNFEKALKYYNKSLTIKYESKLPSEIDFLELINEATTLYFKNKEFAKVIEFVNEHWTEEVDERYQDDQEMTSKVLDINQRLYFLLGTSYDFMNQIDEAIEYYQEALEVSHTNRDKSLRNSEISNIFDFNMKMVEISPTREADSDSLSEQIGSIMETEQNENDLAREYEMMLDQFERIYGNQVIGISSIYLKIGEVQEKYNFYKLALKKYKLALTIRAKILGKHSEKMVLVYNKIAEIYFKLKKHEETITFYHLSIEALEESKEEGERQDELGYIYKKIGEVYNNQSNYSEAAKAFEKSFNIAIESKTIEEKELAEIAKSLGFSYHKSKRFSEATDYYKRAIEIYTKLEQDLDILYLYSEIGLNYSEQSKYEQAIQYYNKALAIAKKKFGEQEAEPELAKIYESKAKVYTKQGNIKKAIDNYQKAHKVYAKNKNLYKENIIELLIGMIDMYDKNHEKDKILPSLEQIREVIITLPSDSQGKYFHILQRLGILLVQNDKSDDALPIFKDCLNLKIKESGEHHPDVGRIWTLIGRIQFMNKDYDNSMTSYEKAKEVFVKRFGSSHVEVAKLYMNMGEIFLAKQKNQEAHDIYDAALQIYLENVSEYPQEVANLWNTKGNILMKLNRLNESMKAFSSALKVKVKYFGKGEGGDQPQKSMALLSAVILAMAIGFAKNKNIPLKASIYEYFKLTPKL